MIFKFEPFFELTVEAGLLGARGATGEQEPAA